MLRLNAARDQGRVRSGLVLALCLLGMGAPRASSADYSAEVRGTARNGNANINTNIEDRFDVGGNNVLQASDLAVTGITTVTQFGDTIGGSFASASASLARGELKAFASGSAVRPPFDQCYTNEAEAHAILRDRVTVEGDIPSGSVLRIVVSVHGSIAPDFGDNPFSDNSNGTFGRLDFGSDVINGSGAQRSFIHSFQSGPCVGFGGRAGCTQGLDFNQTFSVEMPISNDARTAFFTIGLNAFSRGAAQANFGNTAHVGFELPAGLSFTSQSGVLLSQAVPLPAPFPLLGVTLAGLALARRRRNAS